MVSQERIVDHFLNLFKLNSKREFEKEVKKNLKKKPEKVLEKIRNEVPRIIDAAAAFFQEGLQIINSDFDQFAVALLKGLQKEFEQK